jgi:hypothetical protein
VRKGGVSKNARKTISTYLLKVWQKSARKNNKRPTYVETREVISTKYDKRDRAFCICEKVLF